MNFGSSSGFGSHHERLENTLGNRRTVVATRISAGQPLPEPCTWDCRLRLLRPGDSTLPHPLYLLPLGFTPDVCFTSMSPNTRRLSGPCSRCGKPFRAIRITNFWCTIDTRRSRPVWMKRSRAGASTFAITGSYAHSNSFTRDHQTDPRRSASRVCMGRVSVSFSAKLNAEDGS